MSRIKNIFIIVTLAILERTKRDGGTVIDLGCVSK